MIWSIIYAILLNKNLYNSIFYYIFISLQDTLDILDDVVKSLFVIILQSLIKMMSLVDLANFQAMLYKKESE